MVTRYEKRLFFTTSNKNNLILLLWRHQNTYNQQGAQSIRQLQQQPLQQPRKTHMTLSLSFHQLLPIEQNNSRHYNYYINKKQQQKKKKSKNDDFDFSRSYLHYYSTSTNSSQQRRIIDLRSDTVTKPCRGMLETSLNAIVGDDVYNEDPTIIELQNYISHLFGKDSSLFLPTCTMANLIATIVHCNNSRCSEMIIGMNSHMNIWEGGNISTISHVYPRLLKEDQYNGEYHFNDLDRMIQINYENDVHLSKTKLVCIENTNNSLGGIPLSKEYINKLGDHLRSKYNVPLHMDGARIWNATVAIQQQQSATTSTSTTTDNNDTMTQLDPEFLQNYCSNVDSISVCLSKGLGTPLGSLLIGNIDFINEAKRIRKHLGGGMRQSGIIASMCLYALHHNYTKLYIDHSNAKQLAYQLQHDGNFIIITQPIIHTNIFYFKLPTSYPYPYPNTYYQQQLETLYGIKISYGYGIDRNYFRIVTHLDIHTNDINYITQSMIQLCYNTTIKENNNV